MNCGTGILNPWEKSFQEARAVSYRTTAALKDLNVALRVTHDPVVKKELTKAIARLRVANKRARLVFEDESLKHAPQGALFEGGEATP